MHDKTNKMTCAPSEDADQPGWSESLQCAQWVAKDPSFLHADGKDSDQTDPQHHKLIITEKNRVNQIKSLWLNKDEDSWQSPQTMTARANETH